MNSKNVVLFHLLLFLSENNLYIYHIFVQLPSYSANNQQLSGAEFSGSQLGTPDYAMKLKGVTYCHATAGNSSDKRIVMGYLYNPQKTGYSISFSYNGGGISYSPSGTAYTAYKTMNLSY